MKKRSINRFGVKFAVVNFVATSTLMGWTYIPKHNSPTYEWEMLPALIWNISGSVMAALVYRVTESMAIFFIIFVLVGVFQWYWIGVGIALALKHFKSNVRVGQ